MNYYVWFSLFAILAYLIATDASVAKYVILIWKQGRINLEKLKWWLQHSPDNPIVKIQIKRNADKLARELFDELQNKIDSGASTDRQPNESVEGE